MYSRKIYRQTPPGYSGTAISPVEEMPDVRFLHGRDDGRASGSAASRGRENNSGGQKNGRIYTQRIPVPPLPLDGELSGQPAGQPASGKPASGQASRQAGGQQAGGQQVGPGSPLAVINQNMTALRNTVGWLVGQLHASDNEKKEILQGRDLKGQDFAPDREESAPEEAGENMQPPAAQMPPTAAPADPVAPVPPIAPAVPVAPVPPTAPNAQPAPAPAAPMPAPPAGENDGDTSESVPPTDEGESDPDNAWDDVRDDVRDDARDDARDDIRQNPYLSAYYHRHPEARPAREGKKQEKTRLSGGLSGVLTGAALAPATPAQPAQPAQLPQEPSEPTEPPRISTGLQPLPSQNDGQRNGQTGGLQDGQRDGPYDSQTNGQTAREKAAPAPDTGSRKIQEIFQEIEKRGLTSRELLLLGIGLLLST